MSKTIVIAGFKGGVGKSTIANFLAEKLRNSLILNLDLYQDAKDFNTSETINLRQYDSIVDHITANKSQDFYIVDAGGFDDQRIEELESDLYILPTKTDYRSLKTTVDSAATIISKSRSKNKKLMFVLNMYENDKELNSAIEMLEQIVSLSNIEADELHLFGIKKSAAVKTSIDKKMSIDELLNSSRLAQSSYYSFSLSFQELAAEVRKICHL